MVVPDSCVPNSINRWNCRIGISGPKCHKLALSVEEKYIEPIDHPAEPASATYAWYVVGVLNLANISALVDRRVLTLMVEPLKQDFGISDVQVSLLIGISFSLFYTILGIPLARLADAGNRRNIIAVSIALWSLFTAICGMTKNYLQLFSARIGVGIGEAGLTPAAVSLISDYFPKQRRVMALAVFQMGIYMGAGIALITAALVIKLASVKAVWHFPVIGSLYPWQLVFFYLGLPGLLISLLILTIKEPLRKGLMYRQIASEGPREPVSVSFRDFLIYLYRHRSTFAYFYGGIALLTMVIFGFSAWVPTYFIRIHGWSTVQAGLTFGGCIAVFSSLGAIAGGKLSMFLAGKGFTDANPRVPMIAALALMPAIIAFVSMPTSTGAVLCLIPICFFGSFQIGAVPAALQEIVPNQMRAQAIAVNLFIVNLIGAGLGPFVVAIVTDYLFKDAQALPYSLLLTMPGVLCLSAVTLYAGLKYFRELKVILEIHPNNP